ncbi:hypothetical protein A2356_01820 [Candidatus Nomurabacteria bacterium RIFOXYB1_FULL_39_16]|uniref:Uncharacterized protein n=1 Tax=Candidatus Nomurabacteria bacterium RIFOXYB1_FULL_39_16 TaxID=1801803 RepID=A0A1F6YRU2_9BACT|nr:MAG: hypothetical protein A2356_01820 [Candidatus Nomurabacteria bacterium RIFOXYB1_FULL_39_16]OGJ14708.1 MAG: hypothetical protein A2585_02595 [Candidatus Nomurabacteria bacterium RIFOXYD1_FULL_39_12]
MKKPFVYALAAAVYIVLIVSIINILTVFKPEGGEEALIPMMMMLSLFVLSAAVMGFIFLSEPFRLYMEDRKQEGVAFFVRIVGFFACFVVLFLVLLFFL